MFSNDLIRPLIPGLLALVVASGVARGQSTSGVIDGAGMFSEDAVRRAKSKVAEIEREYGVGVRVETVTSLKGETIDEAAVRRLERMGFKGIYVFIAQKEHKDEALASPRALQEEVGKARLNEIRDAFTNEFRKAKDEGPGKFDDGLAKGVQEVEKVLAAVRPFKASAPRTISTSGGFLPSTTPGGSSSGGSPLVLREQVRLSLAGARKAIEGAEAKATKEGWKMNIAVVDDGGHLIAFERMDGARPASVATSTTKAVTAATFRQATGPLPGSGSANSPDILLNLSLQNASGGKITTLLGGVPIVVDGQVIGAVGVGGGTSEQDAETAKAGVAAFLEGLKVKPDETREKPKDSDGDSKPKEGDSKAAKPAEAETSPK
jgi:glc operon protein GlcG